MTKRTTSDTDHAKGPSTMLRNRLPMLATFALLSALVYGCTAPAATTTSEPIAAGESSPERASDESDTGGEGDTSGAIDHESPSPEGAPASFEDPSADVETSTSDVPEPGGPPGLAAASPNPLTSVVGFAQINLTTTSGSCGSHASAVAAAKLRGIGSAAIARDIEVMIYGYAGMKSRPGIATVAAAVNRYLTYRNVPWKAVVFHSSSAVAGYIASGSPVIANTSQWGGHYVTIFGLKGGAVHFSDGTRNDGVSAALATGYLKTWSWSSFLGYARGNYIGFVKK